MPYALLIVNAIGAFIIGIVVTVLMQKVALSIEYKATLMIIMVGVYLTLSGLYLVLFLVENNYTFDANANLMLGTFVGNGLGCLLMIWLGLLVSKQI